jgi:cell division protein FtsZ
MKDSGVAIMGSASAEGDKRAIDAIQAALESPLLNNYDIAGVQNILLNITSGEEEITMDEVGEVTDYVQEIIGKNASIIWGTGIDPNLGSKVNVTIIATGFGYEYTNEEKESPVTQPEVQRFSLDGDVIEDSPVNKTEAPKEEIVNPLTDEPEVGGTYSFGMELEREKKKEMIDELYNPVIKKVERDIPANNDIATGVGSYHSAASVPSSVTSLSPDEIEDEKMIEQLENVPAYKRRGFPINREKPQDKSIDERVSRFSLSDDPDKGIVIRKDNPYLHDNVD